MHSYMYKIKYFSPINLSSVNLLIRPAKELKQEEGQSFPPLRQFALGMTFALTRLVLPQWTPVITVASRAQPQEGGRALF